MNKPSVLISGFPGVGKTFLTKENFGLNIIDSDSSRYSKSVSFPNNYVDHIEEVLAANCFDVILISSHRSVRKELVSRKICFYLCYPSEELKEEYLKRYKDRGSSLEFVKMLSENWNKFIKELNQQEGCTHLILTTGEYLRDKILQVTRDE
jgi:adenylate kinase family enzyme